MKEAITLRWTGHQQSWGQAELWARESLGAQVTGTALCCDVTKDGD
jgi:hypothetical protein